MTTMHRLAFFTGIARSGTNLIGRMFGQHPEFAVAIDPFLPILKWFRSSVANEGSSKETVSDEEIPPSAPLEDYYFLEGMQERLRTIQNATLDHPLDYKQWLLLQKDLEERAIHECADLVPHMSELQSTTYAEIWEAGLNLIARMRGEGKPTWVGVKELWCIEFIPHLLKACSASKAVIIIRDPRAVIASMLKMGEQDTSQQAQILSYARHWRKFVAFIKYFQTIPEIDARLSVIRYEDLVQDPRAVGQQLCQFFDVRFDPILLDVSTFWDPSRKATWSGNSSYTASISEIDSKLANQWETYLSGSNTFLIEFLCGPDMNLFGYHLRQCIVPISEAESPVETFLGSYGAKSSWRSDSGDPLIDMGFEFIRRGMLISTGQYDSTLLRRCFLFDEAFWCLRHSLR